MKRVFGSVYGFLSGLANGDEEEGGCERGEHRSLHSGREPPTAAELEGAMSELARTDSLIATKSAASAGVLHVRRALYRLPLSLDLLPAARRTDSGTASAATSALAYSAPGETARELLADATDRRVRLNQLINDANRLDEHASDDPDNSDDERVERRLLIELALVVVDADWDPAKTYVRVHMSNVSALCDTTVVFGDRQVALARSSAEQTRPASSSSTAAGQFKAPQPAQRVDGRACQLNSNAHVEGWCAGCGAQPTMTTLFQTPLSDEQLMRYATELCSELGTHEHAVLRDTLLEVSDASSLARHLAMVGAEGVELEQTRDGDTGVLFVKPDVWRRELLDARRVLDNLPLFDDKRALVELSARSGDGHVSTPPRSLDVVLAAQCLEFVRK
jgi:hypothetical protein